VKLYTYYRSSAAYRVRIALALKGIAYEQVPVDLRAGAQRGAQYLEHNPQGLVPSLEEGGATLVQSLAIIEYLEERYPEPPLLPGTALDRARVRALALAVACDLHPLNNQRVLRYLRESLGQGESAVDAWYRHWIGEGFRALEQTAGRTSDGHYLYGARLTLADVCLVPQVFNARRFNCDLAPYPTLRNVCAYLETLPAFAAAAPAAQPDAP
jgi:maleylpyruvate isomerase